MTPDDEVPMGEQFEFPLPFPVLARKSPFELCSECETYHRTNEPCGLRLDPTLFN